MLLLQEQEIEREAPRDKGERRATVIEFIVVVTELHSVLCDYVLYGCVRCMIRVSTIILIVLHV